MKKAFTLAEILIVLVIIGVLTAILLPVAFKSAPDENVMKFKKANSTIAAIVKELAENDKYFINGDFGIKPNGDAVEEATYMCKAMASTLSTKSVNCSEYENYSYSHISDDWNGTVTDGITYEHKSFLDNACKESASSVGAEIVTPDDVVYYQASPGTTFGIDYHNTTPYSGEKGTTDIGLYRLTSTKTGLKRIYKIFCIDVDGIDKGEDPFGYGIRIDGRILPGARANEWILKTAKKED